MAFNINYQQSFPEIKEPKIFKVIRELEKNQFPRIVTQILLCILTFE